MVGKMTRNSRKITILPAGQTPAVPQTRVIVVPLIQNNRDQYLICKKPEALGVFPGQWGLPGGGIEAKETMEAALRREIREEVGLEVFDIEPLFSQMAFIPNIMPMAASDRSI